MKKKLNKLTAMLASLALMVSLMPAALAATTVDPENDKGNITVTLKYGENPVSGIGITLYRVATGKVVDHNLYFEAVSALAPVELDGLTDKETAQATSDLVGKIQNLDSEARADLAVETVTTNEEGAAKFENLSVGVYLAVQSTSSRYTFNPVLMYLPYTFRDETGAGLDWEFAVTANPKVSYQGDGGGGNTPPPIDIPPDEPPLSPPPDFPPEEPELEDILDEEPPLALLPATGLLQWPIPVMAMAGLLLIAMGLLSEQKRRA